MRFFQDKKGFSLIELMIAVMVLTIGLTGVAAMQLTALSGTFFANSQATGSGVGLAWSEWLSGLMNHSDQDKNQDPATLMWNRENVNTLMSLDSNPNDTSYTEYEMPRLTDDLVKCFNGQQAFVATSGFSKTVVFVKQGSTPATAISARVLVPFTAPDMPPPAPAGAQLVLRIAANVPYINTSTIEVSLLYKNAFVNKRGATMHFVVASNM
jgi:prepilin-type N-terminal cleavage/methylation domain-containing protein